MFAKFFFTLRDAKLPVTLREYLTLIEALKAGVAGYSVTDFYYLSRTTLVKDEKNLDKFDQVFGHCFNGIEFIADDKTVELPDEWLKKLAELSLTDEEKAEVEALGGWEKLMETLQERLKEQEKRHQGGNKWIGTAGRSPFGAYGFNPEGIRIGQKESRNRKAVKVWDKREYKNLDDDVELGTRNIKVAMKRLRQFARQGAADELDLDDTIRSTARNAGFLDLKMRPEKHNTVKVLILFDIGGSMDDHIRTCEELFSAARTEFKHLEFYYFHNFLYEKLWKDNRRRHADFKSTWDVLHTYASDYKLIFVGDATMSPYEIAYAGGSVEHWNEEPGQAWMERVLDVYHKAVWLNPVPEKYWDYTPSVQMVKQLMTDRMYPLTIGGLEDAMKELSR
ncbi:MAG: VWA domain-containing protein [Sneathiella sp.]|nr:VWA domain-containing protein [Sneathiella sp.]